MLAEVFALLRLLVCGLATATALGACSGAPQRRSPEPSASAQVASAATRKVCRTFEQYSATFTKRSLRDARAENEYAFGQDVMALQAAIGVALYGVRDPDIAHELHVAKRAAAGLLEDQVAQRSERDVKAHLLRLNTAQTAIKQSCQKVTSRLAA
jgi:hypothetical protein